MRLEHRKTLPRAYARFCTVSGNARPGMPSRTARSRVAPSSHHPRAQSPRPVWVCGAFSPFVPLYIRGEVLCSTLPMCTHVYAYYLLYRIVPGRTPLLALEACGNSRSMATHGHAGHTCSTVLTVCWWHLCGPQFIPKSSSHLHYASNTDRESWRNWGVWFGLVWSSL